MENADLRILNPMLWVSNGRNDYQPLGLPVNVSVNAFHCYCNIWQMAVVSFCDNVSCALYKSVGRV